ncbi:MAG: HAMP domain-containing protein [Planctomycetota bacterium]
MLRSRFFWKLFGSYAILVLITTLVVSYFVGRYMETARWDAKVESLRSQCVLLAPYARGDFAGWEANPPAEAEADVRRMAGENGIRVTFIRRDGKVVLDTAEEAAGMENHLGRPEVQEALVRHIGTSQRFGRTLGADALYVANVADEQHGIVRTSVRAKDNAASLGTILARTATGGSLAALVALILGYLGARRITAPITEMTEAARAMQAGDYDQRIVDLPEDELGVLGTAFNQMGQEVRARLEGISLERGRLSAILAGMAEAVLAVGEDDRISFSNRAAERLFRMETDGAKGRKLWTSCSCRA